VGGGEFVSPQEPQVRTSRALEATLFRVSFAPSCLDMGWGWETEPVISTSALSGEAPLASGWLIRTTFRRPDTATGKVGLGKGRWWYIASGATETSVFNTAWMAYEQILKHELMEGFLTDGVRPFDPHLPNSVLTAPSHRRS
jgi:hypothetical protein